MTGLLCSEQRVLFGLLVVFGWCKWVSQCSSAAGCFDSAVDRASEMMTRCAAECWWQPAPPIAASVPVLARTVRQQPPTALPSALHPPAVFMHDKFNRATQRADETSMVVVTKTVRVVWWGRECAVSQPVLRAKCR